MSRNEKSSLKSALTLQYSVFKSQFDSFHRHLGMIAAAHRGLNPLTSTAKDEFVSKFRTSKIPDTDCSSVNIVSSEVATNGGDGSAVVVEVDANGSVGESRISSSNSEGDFVQPQPQFPKTNRRLPVVYSDTFELKLIELIDKNGSLSNAEAARFAAKLFREPGLSWEHRR